MNNRLITQGRALLAAVGAGALLSGCMVGPNFQRPDVAAPSGYARAATADADSRPDEARIAPEWWTLFGDPELVSLEKRLADSNLDVRAATARLLQSRAVRRVAGAKEYPTVNAAGSYYREQASANGIVSLGGNTGPVTGSLESADGTSTFGMSTMPGAGASAAYNLWQMGADASWELDLWGGVHRGIEAANAGLQQSAEDRRDILVSAQAELARDYIDYRTTQALLAITRRNLDVAQDNVKLTRHRLDQGVTTNLDVANALALVASVEARLPTLEARRDALINAISLLLGQGPSALTAELSADKDIPALPAKVPVGLPSELAQRRPDIRRAEAKLHQATAEIGVAKADFYPKISLTGSFGNQSLQLSNLGAWASHQFMVGPSVSLPFFQGGRLKGTLELRKAEQQEAAILYQRTVLQAWHEVDDAMTSYEAEQHRRDRLAEAVAQNEAALTVAERRYKAGAIDYLNVLAVQRALLNAESDLASSGGAAASNLITLYKALGGGWETDFPDAAPTRLASSSAIPGSEHP